MPQMGFHDHAETLKKLDEQFYIDTHRYLILNMLRSKRKLFLFFKNIRIFVVWASIPLFLLNGPLVGLSPFP